MSTSIFHARRGPAHGPEAHGRACDLAVDCPGRRGRGRMMNLEPSARPRLAPVALRLERLALKVGAYVEERAVLRS